MYRRLTIEDIDKLDQIYTSDSLYQVLLPFLSKCHKQRHDLHPVEIWAEALRVVSKIANSLARDITVESIADQLVDYYREFIDNNQHTVERDMKSAQLTANIVMLVLTYMLSSAAISFEEHPYHSLTLLLVKHLNSCTDLKMDIDCIRRNEEQYERHTGHELPTYDYIVDAVVGDSNNIHFDPTFLKYIKANHKKVVAILNMVTYGGTSQVPALIRYIRALQMLHFIEEDWLDASSTAQVIKILKGQFPKIAFNDTNVKKEIDSFHHKTYAPQYVEKVENIAKYLTMVI